MIIGRGDDGVARRWQVRILACLGAATLLVAGCASSKDDGSAAPLPSTSSSSAAPSSAALPPLGPADFPMPAEARQKTPDGVVAFTRYFVEMTNHLLVSLDSAPLRELSRNCRDCNDMARGYDSTKREGYRFEGGRISIVSLGGAIVQGDSADISFLLEQAPYTLRNSAGSLVPGRSETAFRMTGGLKLSWDAQRSTWIVTVLSMDRL